MTRRQSTGARRHAADVIARLREDRVPALGDERGRTAGVLLDVETDQVLLRRIALLEGIDRGEQAFAEGRTVKHADAKKRLSERLLRVDRLF